MGTPKGGQQSSGRKSLTDEVVAILGRGSEVLEASARPTGGVREGLCGVEGLGTIPQARHNRHPGQGILGSTGGSGADLGVTGGRAAPRGGQRMTLASGSSTVHSVDRGQPGPPACPTVGTVSAVIKILSTVSLTRGHMRVLSQ